MLKKIIIVLATCIIMTILAACGGTKEQPTSVIEDAPPGNASGITLAGQEPEEVVGTLKSIDSEEVLITVSGQDVKYRLSDVAISQIKAKEVENNHEVTFTTFSIGDATETIAEFIIR